MVWDAQALSLVDEAWKIRKYWKNCTFWCDEVTLFKEEKRKKIKSSIILKVLICVYIAIFKQICNILTSPCMRRCKKTWQIRNRCPFHFAFWRPVEPDISIYSSRWANFTFFPLFLAHAEISAKCLSQSVKMIIFYAPHKYFVDWSLTAFCGSIPEISLKIFSGAQHCFERSSKNMDFIEEKHTLNMLCTDRF